MALRWAAASFVETEKSYRRIIGCDQLWMLKAHLDDHHRTIIREVEAQFACLRREILRHRPKLGIPLVRNTRAMNRLESHQIGERRQCRLPVRRGGMLRDVACLVGQSLTTSRHREDHHEGRERASQKTSCGEAGRSSAHQCVSQQPVQRWSRHHTVEDKRPRARAVPSLAYGQLDPPALRGRDQDREGRLTAAGRPVSNSWRSLMSSSRSSRVPSSTKAVYSPTT